MAAHAGTRVRDTSSHGHGVANVVRRVVIGLDGARRGYHEDEAYGHASPERLDDTVRHRYEGEISKSASNKYIKIVDGNDDYHHRSSARDLVGSHGHGQVVHSGMQQYFISQLAQDRNETVAEEAAIKEAAEAEQAAAIAN